MTSFDWRAQTTLSFEPVHYNQSAGIICEYDARAFIYFNVTWDEARACRVIDVLVNANGSFSMPLGEGRICIEPSARAVTLGMEVHDGREMRPFYAIDGGAATEVSLPGGAPLELDASVMSDEGVEGWAYTGMMVGLTCVDMWDKSSFAVYSCFAYEDLDTAEVER